MIGHFQYERNNYWLKVSRIENRTGKNESNVREQILSRNVILVTLIDSQETTCNDLIVNLYVTEKNNNSTDILSVHKLKLKNGIARIIKKKIYAFKRNKSIFNNSKFKNNLINLLILTNQFYC